MVQNYCALGKISDFPKITGKILLISRIWESRFFSTEKKQYHFAKLGKNSPSFPKFGKEGFYFPEFGKVEFLLLDLPGEAKTRTKETADCRIMHASQESKTVDKTRMTWRKEKEY